MQLLEKKRLFEILDKVYKDDTTTQKQELIDLFNKLKFHTITNVTKSIYDHFPELKKGVNYKTKRWMSKTEYDEDKLICAKLTKTINLIREHDIELKKLNKGGFPQGCHVIYKVVTGSQSFGLATETSDVDVKGVYIQDSKQMGLFDEDGYRPTIVINKDETYFELKRYLELLLKGDALALEMLFSSDECVIQTSKAIKKLKSMKSNFITKKLYYTFYEYAVGQFKKASNFNRKANWDENKITRKYPSDFTKFMERHTGRTNNFRLFLSENNIPDDEITLVKLDGFVNGYKVYHFKTRGWWVEDGNELRTGVIPKENNGDWIGTIYFNHHEYSEHCKEYKEYTKWLSDRSDERYNTNKEHAQKYDAKNIMHTVRLIMVATEIPVHKKVLVDRTENREYLLSIKKGELPLKEVLDEWLLKGVSLLTKFEESDLPNLPNKEIVSEFLRDVRFGILGNKKLNKQE